MRWEGSVDQDVVASFKEVVTATQWQYFVFGHV